MEEENSLLIEAKESATLAEEALREVVEIEALIKEQMQEQNERDAQSQRAIFEALTAYKGPEEDFGQVKSRLIEARKELAKALRNAEGARLALIQLHDEMPTEAQIAEKAKVYVSQNIDFTEEAYIVHLKTQAQISLESAQQEVERTKQEFDSKATTVETLQFLAEALDNPEVTEAASLNLVEFERLQIEKSQKTEERVAKAKANPEIEKPKYLKILEPYQEAFKALCENFSKNTHFTEKNQAFSLYTDAILKLMERIARREVKELEVINKEYATIQKTALAGMEIDNSSSFTIVSNAFLSKQILPLYYRFKNYRRGNHFFPGQHDSAEVELFNSIAHTNQALIKNLIREINKEDSIPPDASQEAPVLPSFIR